MYSILYTMNIKNIMREREMRQLKRWMTCSPSSACRMVRFPLFFRVKTMTFPVWLNLGAPAT